MNFYSIRTNDQNTIDFLDIVGGVNFKVENHRKRLRYIENLDTADWHKIIHNANVAGARTCEYLGAMEAFKHLSNDIFNWP